MPNTWPLPEGVTLRVWNQTDPAGSLPIFESRGKWLHPLFELTEFLSLNPELQPRELVLRDRIIGRAAAFLILRMGLIHVGAEIVSRRAISLFALRGWEAQTDTIVDRIDCQTEDLLAEVNDIDEAWELLRERRRKALQGLQRPES